MQVHLLHSHKSAPLVRVSSRMIQSIVQCVWGGIQTWKHKNALSKQLRRDKLRSLSLAAGLQAAFPQLGSWATSCVPSAWQLGHKLRSLSLAAGLQADDLQAQISAPKELVMSLHFAMILYVRKQRQSLQCASVFELQPKISLHKM
jgi:hypothetical protein